MIVLDTHIWVWWVTNSNALKPKQLEIINKYVDTGLIVSVISIWEIAKLVEYNRLKLNISLNQWLSRALSYPGIQKIDLLTDIIIQSTQLKGKFHKDPADQIIVATSKVLNIPLLTADDKILAYPYVELAK